MIAYAVFTSLFNQKEEGRWHPFVQAQDACIPSSFYSGQSPVPWTETGCGKQLANKTI